MESHPLRVRGLKLKRRPYLPRLNQVASFTGAWIETGAGLIIGRKYLVASFTGAWIETEEYPGQIRGLSRILYGCVD